MFPINYPLAFNREINSMKKLNSKYVESIVKKAAEGKIVAVHEEKLWNTVQIEKRQETRSTKKKGWKAGMEAGAKSPVEKNSDLEQEIPWKQITS